MPGRRSVVFLIRTAGRGLAKALNMNRGTGFVLGVLLLATSVPLTAEAGGDVEQGRRKSAQCIACHGVDGRSPNPTFPDLAGQNATYLHLQLRHFRSGKRHHAIMSPIAQALSDEDIADLSMYFSEIGQQAGAP